MPQSSWHRSTFHFSEKSYLAEGGSLSADYRRLRLLIDVQVLLTDSDGG